MANQNGPSPVVTCLTLAAHEATYRTGPYESVNAQLGVTVRCGRGAALRRLITSVASPVHAIGLHFCRNTHGCAKDESQADRQYRSHASIHSVLRSIAHPIRDIMALEPCGQVANSLIARSLAPASSGGSRRPIKPLLFPGAG